MGRGGDCGLLRFWAPGPDEIASRITIWVNRLELGRHLDQLRMIVAQSRTAHVGNKVQNYIGIYVGTKGPYGWLRTIPDESFVVSG